MEKSDVLEATLKYLRKLENKEKYTHANCDEGNIWLILLIIDEIYLEEIIVQIFKKSYFSSIKCISFSFSKVLNT